MIKTVIIDDEPNARNTLKSLLSNASSKLHIVAEADDVSSGVALIEQVKPEVVFLDIQLKSGTGFDLLAQLKSIDAEIVFVTAYDNYAIKAFQFAAFGYLLKPLQINELSTIVNRLEENASKKKNENERLKVLIENFDEGNVKKIVIQNVNGFRVLTLQEIVYMKGDINYTHFILKGGDKIMTSKTLKEYEKLLTDFGFYRIHQSSLINLSHVKSYMKGEGGVVTMVNGDHLNVSRRKKSGFVKSFLG